MTDLTEAELDEWERNAPHMSGSFYKDKWPLLIAAAREGLAARKIFQPRPRKPMSAGIAGALAVAKEQTKSLASMSRQEVNEPGQPGSAYPDSPSHDAGTKEREGYDAVREVVSAAKAEVASWPDWKKPSGLAPSPSPGVGELIHRHEYLALPDQNGAKDVRADLHARTATTLKQQAEEIERLRQAVAEAYEDAAKTAEKHDGVCDGPACYEGDSIVRGIAAAIRALSGEKM